MATVPTPAIIETLTESYLIICEGPGDRYFFREFVKKRGITGLQVIKHAGGKGGFKARLEEIEVQIDASIRGILLVIDNDSRPGKTINFIGRQIRDTGLYAEPTARLTPARRAGRPTIGILSIPWGLRGGQMRGGRKGNLEKLILDTLLARGDYTAVVRCLERYQNCTPAKDWIAGKQAKMKLRCLIAATCKKDPSCNVLDMWETNKGFQPVLLDPGFHVLEDELRKFLAW